MKIMQLLKIHFSIPALLRRFRIQSDTFVMAMFAFSTQILKTILTAGNYKRKLTLGIEKCPPMLRTVLFNMKGAVASSIPIQFFEVKLNPWIASCL